VQAKKGKGFSAFDRVFHKAKKMVRIGGSGGSSHSFTEEEKVAFVQHINSELMGDKDLERLLPIDSSGMDVFEAVKDGVLLCKLINASAPDTIDMRAVNVKGKKNAWQINENHDLCINSAKGIGCSVVNIGAEDLKEGRPHLVLGLMWQIIKIGLLQKINLTHHPELVRLLEEGEELQDLLKLPAEHILLRWVNYHLKNANHPRKMGNFSGDVKDSEIYTILLDKISGGRCDRSPLKESDLTERAEKMLVNADKVDCRKYITPRDVVHGNSKLNLAFVANAFNTLPALDPMTEDEEAQYAELMDFDQEGTREERSFRFWIQSLDVEVNHLFEDVRDGVILLKVFDVIAPGCVNWKRVNKVCKNKFKKIENVNYVIDIGKDLRFSLVNIGGMDILDGNRKLILALVWQMMRHNILEMLRNLGGGKRITEDGLVKWANSHVAKAGKSSKITSFQDKSLANGLFLLDLCAAVSPRSVNDEAILPGETDEDKELNAKYAISVARKMGATLFLLWEDIVEINPKMIMTFVAGMMMIDRTK
jgi:plastin-1